MLEIFIKTDYNVVCFLFCILTNIVEYSNIVLQD